MSKPTKPQLAYLRSLAECSGQTFTYPQTFDEASAEIDRLKGSRRSHQASVAMNAS